MGQILLLMVAMLCIEREDIELLGKNCKNY